MNIEVSSFEPSTYVSRIASKAGVSGIVEREALRLIDSVKGMGALLGKGPVSIDAAALYLTTLKLGRPVTQLRVAAASRSDSDKHQEKKRRYRAISGDRAPTPAS